jgi:hypothetical protein
MLAAMASAAVLVLGTAEAAPAGSSAAPAASAAAAAPSDAMARYQKERAACLSGQSNQDRTTCLKEAGAALAEARHRGLGGNGGPQVRALNASERCKGLPTADAQACMARMQGAGSTSGSVAGGGILRELVTVEPAASAASR